MINGNLQANGGKVRDLPATWRSSARGSLEMRCVRMCLTAL